MAAFWQGLAKRIKDELAGREITIIPEHFMSSGVQIDASLPGEGSAALILSSSCGYNLSKPLSFAQ